MTPPLKIQAQSNNCTFDYSQQAQTSEPYLSELKDDSRNNISSRSTGQFASQQALVPDGLTTQLSGPGSWPSATTNGPTSSLSEGYNAQGYNTVAWSSPDARRERQKRYGSALAYSRPEDAVPRSFDGNYLIDEPSYIPPNQESATYSQALVGAYTSSPNLAAAGVGNGSPTGDCSAWPTSTRPFSSSVSQHKPQVSPYNSYAMQATGPVQIPPQSSQFINKENDILRQTPRIQGLSQFPTPATPRNGSLTNTSNMPQENLQMTHSSSYKHPRSEAMTHMQQPSAYLFGNNEQRQFTAGSNAVPENVHSGSATYSTNMSQLQYTSPVPHGNPYASQMANNHGAQSFYRTDYGHRPVSRSTNITSPNNIPWGHINAGLMQHRNGYFHNNQNINAHTGQMNEQYYDSLLAQHPQLGGHVLSRVQGHLRNARQPQSHMNLPINAMQTLHGQQQPGWHVSTRRPIPPPQGFRGHGENVPAGHGMDPHLQWPPAGAQQHHQLSNTYQQPAQPVPVNGADIVATKLRNLDPADWDRNFASTSPSPVPADAPPVRRHKRSNNTVKDTAHSKAKNAPKKKRQCRRKPEGYYNSSVANSVLAIIQDSDSSPGSKYSKSSSPEMLSGTNRATRGGPQSDDHQKPGNTSSSTIAGAAMSVDGPPSATSMFATPNFTSTQDETCHPQSGGPSGDPKSGLPPSGSSDSANPYHVHSSELLTPEKKKAAVLRVLNQAFMDNPFAVPNSDYRPSKLNELPQHPRSGQARSGEQAEDVNNKQAESGEKALGLTAHATQFGTTAQQDAQEDTVNIEMHGGNAANTESTVQQLTAGIRDSETAPPDVVADSTSPTGLPVMTPQGSPEPRPPPPPPTPAQALGSTTPPDQSHAPMGAQPDQPLHTDPTDDQDQVFDVFGLSWDNVGDDDDFNNLFSGDAYMGTDDLMREFEAHETRDDST